MGRRVRRIVALQVGLSLTILSLTEILIGSLGITGAGIAFFAGQALMACIVLPSVIRQYRRAGMAPGFDPGGAGGPGSGVGFVAGEPARGRRPARRPE